MRIATVGGGPAGLFFAVLAQQTGHSVTVHERLPRAVSHGWGVVFWEELVESLRAVDPQFANDLEAHAFVWRTQIVDVDGTPPVALAGDGFSIGRDRLLEMLAQRAEQVGVELRYEHEVSDLAELGSFDLVVAADGVRSPTRTAIGGFGTRIETLRNRFMWLGADRAFEAFRFPVHRVGTGWIWGHGYGFDPQMSTFVIETTPDTWAAEFEGLDGAATLTRLEAVFAPELRGARLLYPAGMMRTPTWTTFPEVWNERWNNGNVALLGDAAHTTHFSIGSGTRLGLQDAIALHRALLDEPDVQRALVRYSDDRIAALQQIQEEAHRSALWFEGLPSYIVRGGSRFPDLLERRRSAVMPRLPLPLYLHLSHLAGRGRRVTRAVRRAAGRG